MKAPLQTPVQEDQTRQLNALQRAPDRQTTRDAGFVDNRPVAAAQRKLQAMIGSSPRVSQQKIFADMINNSPRMLQQKTLMAAIQHSPRMAVQRRPREMLFGGAAQRLADQASHDRPQAEQAMAESPQANSSSEAPLQLAQAAARKPNHTGLPDQLKSGIESISGMSMDHVKVHYNSSQPAQLNAHAYAQGNAIHVGPGQEKHLPHEAWHVVQQAQGRVRPTMQMMDGVPVNDDKGLEAEADAMGGKALQLISRRIEPSQVQPSASGLRRKAPAAGSNRAIAQLHGAVAGSPMTGRLQAFQPIADRRGARPLRGAGGPVLQAQWAYVNQQGTPKINLAATHTPNVYVYKLDGSSYTMVNTATDGYPIVTQIGNAPATTPVHHFQAGTMHFTNPQGGVFSAQSAWDATQPYANGNMATLTGHQSGYGVKIGDVGSYKAIQHLEKTGDQLTGDHQPSGAAIKLAIRQQLHAALNQVLTRGMANVAYQKAITVVMSDAWHKAESRTYGGRNSQAQILHDAGDLLGAAMEDWKKTVPELEKQGYTQQQILQIWTNLDTARQKFYTTGDPQIALL